MAHSMSRPSQSRFLARERMDNLIRHSESCESDNSYAYEDQPQMMLPNECSPMGHQFFVFDHTFLCQPPVLPQSRTVRVACKGNTDFALGVRDGNVVMMIYHPNDPSQQWLKDESWSRSVTDSVGHPAFCLVNKATNKALRHAPGVYQKVLLTNYEPGSYKESVMWSQSEDMGEGFKTIRMAHNIQLNLDVFQGDVKNGGIKDGDACVLWTWNQQDNQLWKISSVL